MKKLVTSAIAVAVILLVAAPMAHAAKWKRLGTEPAVPSNQSVEITVKKSEMSCCQIKIKVAKGWITLHSATITFADGTSQEVDIDQDVQPGSTTDPIKIDGEKKQIVKVELSYEAKTRTTGKAMLSVFGLPA